MSGVVRAARLAAALGVIAIGGTVLAQEAVEQARLESQREAWQKVDEIFEAMGVRPGAAVADIGAGEGFFTARLSRAVGDGGRVFAVDVSARSLRDLRHRVADEQLSNVAVIEGAADDPKLPAGTLDAALIVNAYHEMRDHHAMLTKIKAALKPGGRLVIVEPISPSRRNEAREAQTRRHEIAVEHVQDEAREAGFRVAMLQDPFIERKGQGDEEWLLVLTPVSAPPVGRPGPPAATRSPSDDWTAPELRIPVDEFKRLVAAQDVLIVDVRDAESFRRGHLPGAVLITMEDIAAKNGAERLRNETRAIVTYCS